MNDAERDRAIEQLAAREAIRDVLARYARGVDRCDRELLRSVYWPDGTEDHGGTFVGLGHDFIDHILTFLTQQRSGQKLIGNMMIRVDGSEARSEAYFFSYNRLPHPDGGLRDCFLGGRYLDRMERRGAEWRIKARVVVFDWFREAAPTDYDKGFLNGGPRRMGEQGADDAVYSVFPGELAPLAI